MRQPATWCAHGRGSNLRCMDFCMSGSVAEAQQRHTMLAPCSDCWCRQWRLHVAMVKLAHVLR